MNRLKHDLVRERSTYPIPQSKPDRNCESRYEWKFDDQFGNGLGQLKYRDSRDSQARSWIDVLEHSAHLAQYVEGCDFAIAATTDGKSFSLQLIKPPNPPATIYRQACKLEAHGLSADGEYLLAQSAKNGDWMRPELLVLDLAGGIRARISEIDGVAGCWAGSWATGTGDYRVIVHHEPCGFLQPAIWSPFEGRLEKLSIDLEGEVFAIWDKFGEGLLLKRSLKAQSDLHRFNLQTGEMEIVQPLDGTVFEFAPTRRTEPLGYGPVAAAMPNPSSKTVASQLKDFNLPLGAWSVREANGVPCLTAQPTGRNCNGWTIFHGYGSSFYHYSDAYYSRLQCYLDHGYKVALVNTRGCSGYGREWREATLGKIGFTELEDMKRARAALIEEGFADEDRAIISGDSWGGFMTLLAMGIQSELWAIGLAFTPVGDFERLATEGTPIAWTVTRAAFKAPDSALLQALRLASPLTYADRVLGPILMMVGRYDLLCPPGQNEAFANAVQAKGGRCQMHIYEGGHGPVSREQNAEHTTLALEFLLRECASREAQVAR